jgi:CRP/FNR family transcriptional regulator, cyclic AMP receptor protein
VRGPYGFEISDSCRACKLQKKGSFCQMVAKVIADFDAVRSSSVYPQGAVLFLEKQDSRGVFVLCEGEVKLSISSKEGKTLILRIARAGEILGLAAVLAGKEYEVTAETLRPCQIAFVRRDDFMRFLAQHPEALQAVAKEVTVNYRGACEQLRTVGLSASASGRLAKLLLTWSEGGEATKLGTRIKLPLTHEEIAACIGSSRETVTRTFGEFRSRNIVTLKGSTLLVSDPEALRSFAGE